MDEDTNTFPMDFYAEDGSPHPWKFRPEGYLVVILTDADEGRRAGSALLAKGFGSRDIKISAGGQILETHAVYAARRTVTDKLAGSVVDDAEGRELYLGYAREGRSALWLRLHDETDVSKALRVLADNEYVHARYYGHGEQQDFRVDG